MSLVINLSNNMFDEMVLMIVQFRFHFCVFYCKLALIAYQMFYIFASVLIAKLITLCTTIDNNCSTERTMRSWVTRFISKDCFKVQLDLGYLATSYTDISIIRPRSCSVYHLLFIHFRLKSNLKQKQSG